MKAISKKGYVWYHYKIIRFHPMISEYLECQCRDGEITWLLVSIIGYEHIREVITKQQARDTISYIKQRYDWILNAE